MRPPAPYTMPPARRRRFALIALPLVGAMFALAAVRAVRDGRSVAPQFALPENPPVTVRAEPVDTADAPAADALLADVYPSRQAAVRALARRLPDVIGRVSDKPPGFRMDFDDRAADGAPLYDAVRKNFPGARLTGPADATPRSADELAIGMRIDEETTKPARNSAKGNVQITIAGPARTTTISTKFTRCDWADDLTNYVNENPGHNWIVVRSRKPGPSPTDARRSAEEVAVAVLQRLVRPPGPSRVGPIDAAERPAPSLPVDIHQLPIAGRFLQQFRRPYGTVWEEAILLDASRPWVESVELRQAAVLRARGWRIQNTFASMAVVLVAILLAYAFADVVTKRYFTGRLRAVAIASALLAVGVAVGIISVV